MTQTTAQREPSVLVPGTVLGDRFEVEGVLGEGAMGVVYRAQDGATGRGAAVKVLRRHLISSREYVSRFKREAHAASRFRHDAAVRVLGTGETEDHVPYIAMELVEGRSLRDLIHEEAPLAPGRAASLVEQLLQALAAAHSQGIVHRDMKPDNIRVVLDEDGIERPKILDFGVSKFIQGDLADVTGGLKTKTGVVLGTPKYMAPEQIRGEAIDGRADIYAVGAMLHEMFTGKPPFEADDVFGFVAMHLKQRVVPITERFPDLDLSPELDEIVLRMLQKDPTDRPADAAALATELRQFAVLDPRASQRGRLVARGMAAVGAAGVLAAGASFLLVPELSPAVAGAAIGLGGGAALAARRWPRPSVYGFVKRIGTVAAALVVVSALFLVLPGHPGTIVAAAHVLAALLAYVAFLAVWSAPHRWLRPVAAGIAAPLLAGLLLPIRVDAGAGRAYFVALIAPPRDAVLAPIEQAAREANLMGLALVALLFGLATLVLPRPGAART